MKKLQLLVCLFIWAANSLNAQNVNIPDANFKAALLASSANTNGDGQIQVSEAAAFNGSIYIVNKSISDLTGIEAFTALTQLYCYNNQLTTLDVSNNTALTALYCHDNQLTSLDISATALTYLSCFGNQLTTLDVSTNTALISLHCYFNQLTTLDVSANTALTYLWCSYNELTTLDASTNTALIELSCASNQLTTLNVKNGNNLNMTTFFAQTNPNLTCIEVDDTTYSTTNWYYKDSTATYSTSCFNSITTLAGEKINLTTYPNPTNNNLTINLEKTYQTTTIAIRNTIRQTVFFNTYNGVNHIDLNLEGAAGVYFVSVRTELGEAVMKVVKN